MNFNLEKAPLLLNFSYILTLSKKQASSSEQKPSGAEQYVISYNSTNTVRTSDDLVVYPFRSPFEFFINCEQLTSIVSYSYMQYSRSSAVMSSRGICVQQAFLSSFRRFPQCILFALHKVTLGKITYENRNVIVHSSYSRSVDDHSLSAQPIIRYR